MIEVDFGRWWNFTFLKKHDNFLLIFCGNIFSKNRAKCVAMVLLGYIWKSNPLAGYIVPQRGTFNGG